jgi:alcohol dehydrogenase (cytochrome c)
MNLKRTFSIVLNGVTGSNETFPVEVAGVLYITTPDSHVLALDATNGDVIWSYTPSTHALRSAPRINRGVAVGDKKVYVLTADDQLMALDQVSGK